MKKKKTKRMAEGGLPATAPTAMTAAQKAALPRGLANMAQLPAGLRNRAGGLPPGLQRRMPATPAAPAANTTPTMAAGGMAKPAKAARPAKPEDNDRNENAAAGGGRGTGLPPGLAKRGPGNLPPGLAKKKTLPAGLTANRGAQSDQATKRADDAAKKYGYKKPTISTGTNPLAPTQSSAIGALAGKLPKPWGSIVQSRFGTTMKKGGMVRGQGCAVRGLKTSKKMG